MAWLEREKLTWELESTLPDCLIQEYENNIRPSQSTLTDGIINHMLVIGEVDTESEPPSKKKKSDIKGMLTNT